MAIRVHNQKTHGRNPGDFYIGRPSVLGNPFSHMSGTLAKNKVATRDEAVAAYKKWILQKLAENGPEKKEFDRLVQHYKENHHMVLVCWYAPQKCHGDILAELIAKKAAE